VANSTAPQGQITVDASANDGSGTLALSSSVPNGNLSLAFCPFPGGFQFCLPVTSFTAAPAANQSVNFRMPQKGAFSGAFELLQNGAQIEVAEVNDLSSAVSFKAALLPASSISGGIGAPTGPEKGSGSVAASNSSTQVVLQGASPSHSFSVASCDMFGLANCLPIGTITTDGSGNGTANMGVAVMPMNQFGNIYLLGDSAGVEYISGFLVQ
jgi:hypothetical protein